MFKVSRNSCPSFLWIRMCGKLQKKSTSWAEQVGIRKERIYFQYNYFSCRRKQDSDSKSLSSCFPTTDRHMGSFCWLGSQSGIQYKTQGQKAEEIKEEGRQDCRREARIKRQHSTKKLPKGTRFIFEDFWDLNPLLLEPCLEETLLHCSYAFRPRSDWFSDRSCGKCS